ncbi:MAG: DUF928 domain-containing protein [Lysobacterales bacterium]
MNTPQHTRRAFKPAAMVLAAFLGLSAAGVWAQGADGDGISYRPHNPSAPAATVGGSIRGAENTLALTILAPPTLAATANASPTIYWHVSQSTGLPVELVLIEEGGETALAEQVLSDPLNAGVHSFTVPPDTPLTPGTVYQFSVAAVADADIRSNDVFASTLLTFTPLQAPSAKGGATAIARRFAAQGAWYDALHALRTSDTPEARQLWSAMLKQASLDRALTES